MIHFVTLSEGHKSVVTQVLANVDGGKFITLTTGEFIFSDIKDHRNILFAFSEATDMEFDTLFNLDRRSGWVTGGHWSVEGTTLKLTGYSETYGQFDRMKAEAAREAIGSAFSIERVVIE